MEFPRKVRLDTESGTLVTVSPAYPGLDVVYWTSRNLGGTGRTQDPGPYVLIEIMPPTANRNVWRPAKCITLKGEERYFSHLDLNIWDYGQ
jgi:hypothetical protein